MDNIYTEYFNILKDAIQKYGQHTVLLMQVGAFLEIYGTSPSPTTPPQQTRIYDVCSICDLNISEKKTLHQGQPLFMAGFRDFTAEKYIQKMVDANYTVVVYLQEKNEKNATRKLHAVYSAGTYLPFETDTPAASSATNNIMCIWLDVFSPLRAVVGGGEKQMVCGVAVSNIYTGTSYLFEYQTAFQLTTSTFDELERLVSVHQPSEIVIISAFSPAEIATIIQYTGIKTRVVHQVAITDTKAVNSAKQNYIQTMLTTQYDASVYASCSEFAHYPVATQAFVFLLNFIQEHNPNLVKHIALPTFSNTSTRVVLANHTLKQLNILDDAGVSSGGGGEGEAGGGMLSSVAKFLNKCCSSGGRRAFHTQLVNPVFDTAWLQTEYDMIETMLKDEHYSYLPMFRKQIREICDLEKVGRQLVAKRLYPNSIWKLYKSIQSLSQIHVCLFETQSIVHYLCNGIPDAYATIERAIQHILGVLDAHVIVDACSVYNSLSNFDECIIQRGVVSSIDTLVDRKQVLEDKITSIHKHFNDLMKSQEGNANVDYVRLHETEKSGVYLQLTKTRAKTLKTYLAELLAKHPNACISTDKGDILPVSTIQIKSANTSADEIKLPLFSQHSSDLLELKLELNGEIVSAYHVFLCQFETECLADIELLAQYISRLDVLQSKAYVAREYNYCKPFLDTISPKSYVNVRELRHCLIEQLQTNEVYVTNDLCVGKEGEDYGVLIYGTNAVGKTSLIRALGVAVILAQAGMYVPCSSMTLCPYTALFSRILGNDNIFKGLSTFAVEMTELRTILTMADEHSLILGDELCSGTETESALSIFMAGLMDLEQKRASFLFATHFHEIVNYDELGECPHVALKHLAVFYDREKDRLVYDRKLKEGAGTRMYGLEVCKSLHLPQAFLDRAYTIRNKYYKDTQGLLQAKTSKYNAKKIKGMCEDCGKYPASDIHHVLEQHLANADGFVGHVHKNHVANLKALCEMCHQKTHHHG